MKKSVKQIIVVIIIPLVVACIGYFAVKEVFYFNVEIIVKSGEMPIEDALVTITGKDKTDNSTDKDGRVKFNFLKKGTYKIEAVKTGYKKSIDILDFHVVSKTINLKQEITPFSLKSWNKWSKKGNNLEISEDDINRISISGQIGEAGYVSEYINKSIAGKTLILYFSNSNNSSFTDGRMIKVTYNRNNSILSPKTQNLVFGEYISAEDDSVDFLIPNNFDGKLEFVFLNCNLYDLKISAFIE